jgi:sugar phosphate isomerase/epimerase
MRTPDRRAFLRATAATAAGAWITPELAADEPAQAESPLFEISLAEWSLHRTIASGKLDNLAFPELAVKEFGIRGVEYVNQFFKDKAKDQNYLTELKRRAADHGVNSLLIMIDDEGDLGDADDAQRKASVEKHFPWVEAAKFLGCHSIRVNARSTGTEEEQRQRAADGLRQLSHFAASHQLNVIVENHGGLSSNGAWLASVIRDVGLPNCGTLPDFGNFNLGNGQTYDRYQGVAELMPFAKAVSAKSHEFDESGNEIHTDYLKMMKIVIDAGYRGFVGVEYEGEKHSESDGIRLTQKLLERVRQELASGVS